MPFRKIVILAKFLLCEMSSSTVYKIRGAGHNFFQTKRTYLLNEGEKTPFRKVVILVKLLLCETGKNQSLFVN